jgi:hypothetical protein
MSLATLKKKTSAKYNNMSVNQSGFSLNGTHRSQGYIGQDTLGRSFPRTPMNGTEARGHGGCCGTYVRSNIIQSCVTSTNDPTVVKSSVVGNSGQLAKWLHTPVYNVAKPDTTNNINTQQDYISRVEQQAIQTVALTKTTDSECNIQKTNSCNLLPSDFIVRKGKANVFSSRKDTCNTVKDMTGASKSQSLYVIQLTKKCYENDIVKFTHNTMGAPLPGN